MRRLVRRRLAATIMDSALGETGDESEYRALEEILTETLSGEQLGKARRLLEAMLHKAEREDDGAVDAEEEEAAETEREVTRTIARGAPPDPEGLSRRG